MKRRSFLEKALKKFGFTDDQVKDFIEKLDDEYSDDDAAKALASLMNADEAKGNDTIFGEVKGKARADALDPIDNLLKTYVPKLTATQKTEYDKFGPKDSHKKYQFVLKAFADADTKTGDKNYDDLKSDFDTLKNSLTTDYVPKSEHEKVTGNLTAREKEIQHVKILNSAIRSGKLRADALTDRHFERNFVADVNELLTEKGIGDKKIKGILDASGKVMRADSPDQPLLIDGKAVDLNTLAELTITSYGYEKKSDTTTTTTVAVPTSVTATAGKSSALAAMIAEEQANK